MSEELDKIKKTENKLLIGGVERTIRFGFSAWAQLEEKYGSIQKLAEIEKEMEDKPMTYLIEFAWIGLTDKRVYKDGNPTTKILDKSTLLDEYSMGDVKKITSIVMGALYASLPKTEDSEKEDSEKESV